MEQGADAAGHALDPGDDGAARPAVDDGSAEAFVQLQQIVGVPLHAPAVALVEELAQHGEVVLQVVDRLLRARGRRPRERRVPRLARAFLEPFVVGNAAGGRTHHVERVKGRNTRARFAQLDSRIRHVQPLRGCADGKLQRKFEDERNYRKLAITDIEDENL